MNMSESHEYESVHVPSSDVEAGVESKFADVELPNNPNEYVSVLLDHVVLTLIDERRANICDTLHSRLFIILFDLYFS